MRVIGVMPERYGGPEVLREFELPEPHARRGTVRIAVYAAAVNPTDTVVRSGQAHERQQGFDPPFVPGMDIAGVVDEVGPDTGTDLAVGDRVMGIVLPRGSHGGYSDSVVLPVESVVRIPAGVGLVEASTVPMNGLTARLALDLLAIPAGGRLVVSGAAGTLGGYLIQLAKADGLTVIADAAPADRELVSSSGADEIVPRGAGFAAGVRAVAPDGADGAADAALLGPAIVPAIRDGGGLAAVRPFAGAADRGVVVHQVWVREYRKERVKLDRLRRQVEQGVLTPRVAGVFPAERAADAHARLEKGGTRGRLVLRFRPDPTGAVAGGGWR